MPDYVNPSAAEFAIGDPVLVFDRYLFACSPMSAVVTGFSRSNDGVETRLTQSNNPKFPIGATFWAHGAQLRPLRAPAAPPRRMTLADLYCRERIYPTHRQNTTFRKYRSPRPPSPLDPSEFSVSYGSTPTSRDGPGWVGQRFGRALRPSRSVEEHAAEVAEPFVTDFAQSLPSRVFEVAGVTSYEQAKRLGAKALSDFLFEGGSLYAPGDVRPDGSIEAGDGGSIRAGRVIVTHEQATRAALYGWVEERESASPSHTVVVRTSGAFSADSRQSATRRLIELAERLEPTGEIGDGMVAQFHEAAAMARLERNGGGS